MITWKAWGIYSCGLTPQRASLSLFTWFQILRDGVKNTKSIKVKATTKHTTTSTAFYLSKAASLKSKGGKETSFLDYWNYCRGKG